MAVNSKRECELTGKQSVTIVLLENSTHARDVLDSELEHDQVHRSFTYLIILVQISTLHSQRHYT